MRKEAHQFGVGSDLYNSMQICGLRKATFADYRIKDYTIGVYFTTKHKGAFFGQGSDGLS